MKKIILSAAAIAITLAACTKSNNPSGQTPPVHHNEAKGWVLGTTRDTTAIGVNEYADTAILTTAQLAAQRFVKYDTVAADDWSNQFTIGQIESSGYERLTGAWYNYQANVYQIVFAELK